MLVSSIDEVKEELTRMRCSGKHAVNHAITNVKDRIPNSLIAITKVSFGHKPAGHCAHQPGRHKFIHTETTEVTPQENSKTIRNLLAIS